MAKVLVCGDRNWKDKEYIFSILDDMSKYFSVTDIIEGCARGADRTAEEWATKRGIPIMHFPAQWDIYDKGAGPVRNKQMLEEGKPDLVVAFHKSLNTSKGTRHMVEIARKEGVDTFVFPSAGE